MATFSLDKFRSEVLSGAGLARTNRFEVDVLPPRALAGQSRSASLSSLYVEQASFPLLNIFTKSQKIFGPSYQRPITSEYGGEGMPITFHVDQNMDIRNFFEDWMHTIVNPVNFTIGYQEDYTSTIRIRQLNEQDLPVYEVELREAFPRNINLMDLNNGSSNQTHRLNVLFAYRYWVNSEKASKQAVDVPRMVVNPNITFTDVRLKQNNAVPGAVPFDFYTHSGTTDEYGNITDGNVSGP